MGQAMFTSVLTLNTVQKQMRYFIQAMPVEALG
jgi:hypothetical protein